MSDFSPKFKQKLLNYPELPGSHALAHVSQEVMESISSPSKQESDMT